MILDEQTYDRINMLETPQIWYKDQDNLNKQGDNLTWSSKSQTSEMQAIIKDLTSLDKKNLYIKKDKNSWREQEINETSIKISCLA